MQTKWIENTNRFIVSFIVIVFKYCNKHKFCVQITPFLQFLYGKSFRKELRTASFIEMIPILCLHPKKFLDFNVWNPELHIKSAKWIASLK